MCILKSKTLSALSLPRTWSLWCLFILIIFPFLSWGTVMLLLAAFSYIYIYHFFFKLWSVFFHAIAFFSTSIANQPRMKKKTKRKKHTKTISSLFTLHSSYQMKRKRDKMENFFVSNLLNRKNERKLAVFTFHIVAFLTLICREQIFCRNEGRKNEIIHFTEKKMVSKMNEVQLFRWIDVPVRSFFFHYYYFAVLC